MMSSPKRTWINHMSGGADNADYRLGDGLGALSLQPFSVMTGFPGRSPAEALAPCQ
jgi:hypothetical protein